MLGRLALGASYGTLLGIYAYGTAFELALPAPLDAIWYADALPGVLVALALPVGFAIGQLWALLLPLAILLPRVGLAVAGHDMPWEDSGSPLTPIVILLAAVTLFGVCAGIVVRRLLSVGQPRLR